jgi:hypothetical protein
LPERFREMLNDMEPEEDSNDLEQNKHSTEA